MKNSGLYILNGILAVAIIALFVLFFTQNSTTKPAEVTVNPSEKLPVAFVNVDSVLNNYELAKQMNNELFSASEAAKVNFSQKMQAFEKEYIDFQNKVKYNAFTSQERAEKAQQDLQKKQIELQQLEQQISQDLLVKQNEMNMKLAANIDSIVKVYNADAKFHLIFSNAGSGNILYGAPDYDVTKEVIELLNKK